MKIIRPLVDSTKKMSKTTSLFKQFATLVANNNQTYFPESKQKSRWAIMKDHLWWILKNRELHRYYYVYGLDRKQKKSNNIIGYRHFTRLRDSTNLRPEGMNFNYACLMRDKFVFGQFLKSLGFPTPNNIALLDKDGVTWLDTATRDTYDGFINRSQPINGFCKKLRGIRGEGAFALRVENCKMFSGNDELSVASLTRKIEGIYLLQERLTQHPGMTRLHPSSINTIRLVTFNNDGRVDLFFAAVRMGVNSSNVDNWNAGGIAVAIDRESGRLREHGIRKWNFGKRADIHPDTGITFLGYEIPFFKESVQMVCDLHKYFYGMHSIGWDVVITETGPTLLEANEDWDGSFAMCSEENFKEKFFSQFQARQ